MKSLLRRALTLILGSVFVVAGGIKVLNPVQFVADIRNYELIPSTLGIVTLAFYLPWLEIICGLALLFRPVRLGALMLIVGMLLVFIAALILAWARGLDLSCGCFGVSVSRPQYFLWIVRDIGLLLATLFCYRLSPDCLKKG